MGYAYRLENLADVNDPPVARISAEAALVRHGEGQRVAFVDARRGGEWRCAVHKLPGATHLSADPEDTLPILLPGRTAIVYCTSPGEASSIDAARLLRAGGYGSVSVLAGGLAAWRRAGGPMEPL